MALRLVTGAFEPASTTAGPEVGGSARGGATVCDVKRARRLIGAKVKCCEWVREACVPGPSPPDWGILGLHANDVGTVLAVTKDWLGRPCYTTQFGNDIAENVRVDMVSRLIG